MSPVNINVGFLSTRFCLFFKSDIMQSPDSLKFIHSFIALPCHFCESLETAERLFNLFLSQPQLKTTLVFFSWIPNVHELSDHLRVHSRDLILFINLKLKNPFEKRNSDIKFKSLNTLIEKFCSHLCSWHAIHNCKW